jgi:hypothetical protein
VVQRGAGRNRTDEWRFCRPLPYHLATAPRGNDRAVGRYGGRAVACPVLWPLAFVPCPIPTSFCVPPYRPTAVPPLADKPDSASIRARATNNNHHRSRRGYGAARHSGGTTEAGVRGSVSRHRAGRLASRHNGGTTVTAVAPREGHNPARRAIDGGGTLRIPGWTPARRTKRRPNPSRRPLAVN